MTAIRVHETLAQQRAIAERAELGSDIIRALSGDSKKQSVKTFASWLHSGSWEGEGCGPEKVPPDSANGVRLDQHDDDEGGDRGKAHAPVATKRPYTGTLSPAATPP